MIKAKQFGKTRNGYKNMELKERKWMQNNDKNLKLLINYTV